jgi:hypothetical protein
MDSRKQKKIEGGMIHQGEVKFYCRSGEPRGLILHTANAWTWQNKMEAEAVHKPEIVNCKYVQGSSRKN